MTVDQPPIWLILIAFMLALGPLVFIHELGHYLVARWLGVGAETFSIGFGREITGWTDKRGTRWKVGWLPFGGYVKFIGDENAASEPGDARELSEKDKARSFHLRPVWQRFLIVLAGPVANFILAIAIVSGFVAANGVASTPNVVIATVPGSAAEEAGLKPGDRIVAIAGRSTESFEKIAQLTSLYPDQDVRIDLIRDGHPSSINVHLKVEVEQDRFGQEYRVGRLGIPRPPPRYERVPLLQVVPAAIESTAFLTRSMVQGLFQIVTGRRPVTEIGGPLKMAQMAGQQAALGWTDFIILVAILSINLGFINLLPVPILDGGHLLFYAIEGIRRRPVSPQAQDWAFRGGLALILALVIFTTVNDLGSFGLWERLERLIG
jgi:regulator of sigma E protease